MKFTIDKKIILRTMFFFVLFLIMFMISDRTYDTFWSYGFSYGISRGEIPYNDFNMIVTPLAPIFYSLFLHIFNDIGTMYIVSSLLLSLATIPIFSMIKEKGYLIISIMSVFVSLIFPLSYNTLFTFLLIWLVYIEQSKYKHKDILTGVIASLLILTKQSTGVFVALTYFIFIILDRKKVNVLKRLIGMLIPQVIFLIYLLVNKSLYNFFDLCLFSLFDFSKNTNGLNIYVLLFLVFSVITFLNIKKNNNNKIDWYLFASYTMFIPLFDPNHLCWITVIMLIILLKNSKKEIFNYKMFFGIVYTLMFIIFFIAYGTYDKTLFNDLNHFRFLLVDKESLYNYKLIKDYIKKNDVVIYSKESSLYRIFSDQDITYFDLLNKGNWGYHGEKRFLKEFYDSNKKLMLDVPMYYKTKKKTRGDQYMDKILNDLDTEKLKKVDEFSRFYIYEQG